MTMERLHQKTGKGRSEMTRPEHRLSTRVRAALILVDGRRSDDDICRLLGFNA